MDDDKIGKEAMAEIVRDNVHNLNLSDPDANKMFEDYTRRFFSKLEGCYLEAYDDGVGAKNGANLVHNILASGKDIKGKVTVGIGFNMNVVGAVQEWNESGMSKSFADVKSGKVKLTKEEVIQLFNKWMPCSYKSKFPEFFVWRTKLDSKVRFEHWRQEGLIYRMDNAPDNKMPGCDYGCRCWAEPVPDVVSIIESKSIDALRVLELRIKLLELSAICVKRGWYTPKQLICNVSQELAMFSNTKVPN